MISVARATARVLAICCQNIWQEAIAYILEHQDYFKIASADDIELVTLAGAHGVLATNGSRGQKDLAPELNFRICKVGIGAHGCKKVVLFGHTDCVGNPGTTEQHRQAIRAGVNKIQCWNNRVPVAGVLLRKSDQRWQAEEVCIPEKA